MKANPFLLTAVLSFCLLRFAPAQDLPVLLPAPIVSASVMDNEAAGIQVAVVFEVAQPPAFPQPPFPAQMSVDFSAAPPGGGAATPGTFNFTPINTQRWIMLPVNYSSFADNPVVIVSVSNPVNLRTMGPYTLRYPFTKRTFTVSGGTITEGHAGAPVVPFTITIDKAIAENITFTYISNGGTATPGQDYTPVVGNGVITAGSLSTVINVTVKPDTALEANETLGLDISNISVPVLRGNDTAATIEDDDSPPPPGPAPAATAVTEVSGTGATQAWFSITLPASSQTPVTCSVRTRDDTAHAGTDYNPLNPVDISFAPGETQKWVSITVTATPGPEPREQFFLDVVETATQQVRSAPCTIERFAVTDLTMTGAGIFVLTFPTGLGQRYFVEEAASPAAPVWTAASGLLTGTGAPLQQPVYSSNARGFFRVRLFSPQAPGVAAATS